MLRRYLNKDHAYRTGEIKAVHRAVIDDNFGGFGGEAFAASAWKSFAPLVSPDSIFAGDYFTSTRSQSYIWSYGCGGGSFTSASGIGNTANFAADSLQSIFTCLFGSYFGDWDRQDNFLRAPLAQGLTLTNAWSGRPHWQFHHMGLGETIGYSMLLEANSGPYAHNYANGYVHIGFMGDPTLRLDIIQPPKNLQLTENDRKVDLSWTASADNVLGYHVYRKKRFEDLYERMTTDLVTTTSYSDTPDSAREYYYCVRAVRLEEGYSGSYYNASTGSSASITTLYTAIPDVASSFDINIYPNPNQGNFTLEIRGRSDRMDISLYSVDGRLVEQRAALKINGFTRIYFENKDLKPGMYLLRLSSVSGIETRKVMIE